MKEDKCRHNFYGVCDGMQSRSDYRWALWVVRRYGQWVFKKTTGKKFLDSRRKRGDWLLAAFLAL